ncbi:uncharacterized protein LOC114440111 isoform X2 [Parambassis ranga]|uniref:Uncharacterized protein LOC114440111 isoform X2 n=1 Tax=Parambassis ranga TaxID=210632 RepID=A0A6P7IXF4_9TELE|nr:uncharacterized protein LOC114440111 isoform X2 [Parambassis ranga]
MELIQELHHLKDELKELQQQQKLNRIELDSIHEKLKEIAEHSDTAAIRKVRSDRSNCLPCDRPAGKQIPRPPSTALPSHKSARPCTGNALEQHYKSNRVSEVTEGRILIVTKMPLEIRPNTSVSQRRSSPQHVKHHHHHQVEENSVIQSEVKGHLDTPANRNTDPPFSTKYGMCKTKSKTKASASRKTPPTGCLMCPHTPRKLPEDWPS